MRKRCVVRKTGGKLLSETLGLGGGPRAKWLSGREVISSVFTVIISQFIFEISCLGDKSEACILCTKSSSKQSIINMSDDARLFFLSSVISWQGVSIAIFWTGAACALLKHKGIKHANDSEKTAKIKNVDTIRFILSLYTIFIIIN